MSRVVAIIQARMSSTRLPGKVLADIGGKPMLEWVVERTRQANTVNQTVVATTLDPADDPVAGYCEKSGYPFTRGSVHDVLDRYYRAAGQFEAGIVVRITADCPLIDPELIDTVVNLTLHGSETANQRQKPSTPAFDFAANRLPPPWGRTYPIGLDVEVFTFDALEMAWRSAMVKYQREHVTPYFYDQVPADQLKYNQPFSKFSSTVSPQGHYVALMHHTPDYGLLRWTVDTPEDLELVRAIVAYFPDHTFGWKDVLDLVQSKPELVQINMHVQHKDHLDTDDRV